jgi:hypothetical protein
LINLLTLVLLIIVLEFLIFLGLEYPSHIPLVLLPAYRSYYQSHDRKIIQVTDCACYDSGLFYRLRTGDCQFENREFVVTNNVNTAGLRDDEISLDHPKLIVLGDSYAMGWGVAQQESFPQVLEKISQQRVLNAGISSYGTAREVQLFNRLAPDSVQTIFLQYHANDFDENRTFVHNGYRLPIRSRKSYNSLRLEINKRDDYYPLKHTVGISKAISRKLMGSEDETVREMEAASVFMDILRIDKSRVRIVVFKMDESMRMNDAFTNAVDSIAKTSRYKDWNITALRLSDLLTCDDYFLLDDHINAPGREKIAARMVKPLNPLFN